FVSVLSQNTVEDYIAHRRIIQNQFSTTATVAPNTQRIYDFFGALPTRLISTRYLINFFRGHLNEAYSNFLRRATSFR
ncbi:MAG: hypothetical protein NTV54_11795, partial [Ignavibacteriales bacterium]|nr:hypothetical protein [Ignavibacteriales bacterium]